jgi:hypothetical protein
MKSVLLGVDYLNLDGQMKFLEMNTDVYIPNISYNSFDFDALETFLTTESFTKFRVIYKVENTASEFIEKLRTICELNDITFDDVPVSVDAITIDTDCTALEPSVDTSRTVIAMAINTDCQAIPPVIEPKPKKDGYEYKEDDKISSWNESTVGLEGMKVDKMFFQHISDLCNQRWNIFTFLKISTVRIVNTF